MRNYHKYIFTHSTSMHHEELSQKYSHTQHQCTIRNSSQTHIHTLNINAPWGTITHTHSTSIHHEELSQTHIHTLIRNYHQIHIHTLINAPWGTITNTYSHTQHQCTIRNYHKYIHTLNSTSMHHEELSQIHSHTQHQCTMRNYHKYIFTHSTSMHH